MMLGLQALLAKLELDTLATHNMWIPVTTTSAPPSPLFAPPSNPCSGNSMTWMLVHQRA